MLTDQRAQRCLGGLTTRDNRRCVGIELLLRRLGLARIVLARLPIATRLGNRRQHQFESSLEQLGREQRRTLCSRSLQRERTQAPLDFGLPGTCLDEVPFDAIQLLLSTDSTTLVLAKTGNLFDQATAHCWARQQHLIDLILTIATEPNICQDLVDVEAAHRYAVEQVGTLALATKAPQHGELGSTARGDTTLVLKHDFYLGETGSSATLGTTKEHVQARRDAHL